MQQRLDLKKLCKAILSGSIKKDSAVLIEYRGGKLVFENVVKVEEVG
jgi:hypothetical protein